MMSQNTACVLFVVRRDMDVDNLVPVAWWLATARGAKVVMLSMNAKLNKANDPRLGFLAREIGITVDNLYDAYTPSWRHTLGARLRTNDDGEQGSARWRARLLERLARGKRTSLFDEAWCEGLIRHFGVTHIVMDWAKESAGPCGALTRTGRRLGIPSFALPHGVDVWNRSEYFVGALRHANYFRHFDYIITPNHIRRDFLTAGGFPAARIAMLGCARFSPVWERVLGDIVATDRSALPDDGRLKVVWFDKLGTRCKPAELSAILNRVAALPFVRLAVKGKPNSKLSYDPAALSEEIIDGTAIPSFALCEWADVMAGLPSGILLEAFVTEKDLVLMRGIDLAGTCEVFDDPPVCWLADDVSGLIEMLDKLAHGSTERPYRRDDVDGFIRRLLFPDRPRENVLDAYADFIVGGAQARMPHRASLAPAAG